MVIDASSAAIIGIQEYITGIDVGYFCQIGYRKRRANRGEIKKEVFIEATYLDENYGYVNSPMPEIASPEEGIVHKYYVRNNGSEGSLSFMFDDNEQKKLVLPAPFWKDKIINYAVYFGEIDARESDMPGTPDNPCDIYECRVFTDKSLPTPFDVYFSSSDYISVTEQTDDRPPEWGIWYEPGGNHIKFWDTNLLD